MFRADKKPTLSITELTGNPITFKSRFANMPLADCKVSIPIMQQGSGTPSPDNIRDFIAFSGVNISRTGINLWDEEWELGGYSSYTGQKSSATDRIRNVSPISVKPNMTIYNNAPVAISVFYYDINGNYLRYEVIDSHNTFTIASDVYYINFRFDTSYGTTYQNDTSLNYPSTDTSYHAYTGNTYTISFGQTVYSAILDVLTGKLSITGKLKTIDENTEMLIGNGIFTVDDFFDINNDTESVDCNTYQRAPNRGGTSSVMNNNPDYSFCCRSQDTTPTRIMIKDTRFSTLEDYQTWLSTNPVKITVKLAEPIQIPLGGYLIEALKGENNLISSLGTITAKIVEEK